VFCIYLRTNSGFCSIQHKLIGFSNRDEKCLLRGTNWVFKSSSLRFVFKGLTTICQMNRFYNDSRDGVVSVSTRQRAGWSGAQIPTGEIIFSTKFTDQLWGHSWPPIQWVIVGFVHGDKATGSSEWPPLGAETKNEWSCTSTIPYNLIP
jgi:hypothetical protein